MLFLPGLAYGNNFCDFLRWPTDVAAPGLRPAEGGNLFNREIASHPSLHCTLPVCFPERRSPFEMGSGSKVIKLFPCSTQLSMKFKMLISMNITRNSAFFRLRYA